jgi:hypothetical protein
MTPEELGLTETPELRVGLAGNCENSADLLPGADRLPNLAAAADCDLVVVDQQWPDEFTLSEAEALLSETARVVCCYGPWCDSDGRTRSVWPHAVRTPRSECREAVAREAEILHGHRPAPPLTAARDELFLLSQPADVRLNCAIVVDSPDRTLQDVISARLVAAGCELSTDDSLVVIVDADPWNETTRDRVVRWRDAPNVKRVIALTGFRRDTEVSEMQSAGAHAVLDKLDLERQLLKTLGEIEDRST